jgi:CheY-like chemotaxis protein
MEALQAARVLPPDLLISDVLMPLISGIELALQMRKLMGWSAAFSPSGV